MTETYYKVDSVRISFREYWIWKPGLPFVWLALRKLLVLRLPATVFVPANPRLMRVESDPETSELRRALQPAIQALAAHGGRLLFFYQVPTRGSHRGLAAAVIGPEGAFVALAPAAKGPGGASRRVSLGLVSRLPEGRFLTTSSAGSLFDPPACVDARRMPGRAFPDIVAAHEARVAQRRRDVQPVPEAEVEALILELSRLQLHANVARGIYVPATEDEMARWEPAGRR